MRTFRQLLVAPLVLLTALAAPAFAQDQAQSRDQHAVAAQAIAGAVAAHVANQDTERATIREALTRPEVRDMAAKTGVDLQRVTSSVDSLTGADLQRAAAAAERVNQALVGGASTIVLSTTTIILVLLLLLVIVIAA
jgi:hypothetical protein